MEAPQRKKVRSMASIPSMSSAELAAYIARVSKDYDALCAKRLRIDMTRSKPGPDKLDLSSGMLALPGNRDYILADSA